MGFGNYWIFWFGVLLMDLKVCVEHMSCVSGRPRGGTKEGGEVLDRQVAVGTNIVFNIWNLGRQQLVSRLCLFEVRS